MFLSNLAESQQEHITLSGVDANMVGLLIDYAYTSFIMITENNVQVIKKLSIHLLHFSYQLGLLFLTVGINNVEFNFGLFFINFKKLLVIFRGG